MPLSKTALKASIIAAAQAARDEDDVEVAFDKFADKLAEAIDTYVRTATVTTTVVGAGVGSNAGGPVATVVNGTGTGTLS